MCAATGAFAEYSYSLKDIPLTIGAASLSIWGDVRYRSMEKPAPEDVKPVQDLLPWDRPFAGRYDNTADVLSDCFSVFAITPLAMGGYSWYSGRWNGIDFAGYTMMYAQALAIQNGLNFLARSAQIWPRPYIYATEGEGRGKAAEASGEAYGSFFSGHASAAFTTAVFTADLFSEMFPASAYKGVVWASSLSLATFVCALRVAAGKHYPTDVAAGAVVGAAVSVLVLELHRSHAESVSVWAAPSAMGLDIKF